MLKLQRDPKGKDITIRLKSDEPTLNRRFLKGFFLAVTVHALAFSLVDVKDMKPQQWVQRRPIAVSAERGNSSHLETAVTALQIDQQGMLPRHILAPETQLPDLPSLPKAATERKSGSYRGEVASTQLFEQIEKQTYHSSLERLQLVDVQSPIRLRLSGDLAERRAQTQAVNRLAQGVLDVFEGEEASFLVNVRVDDQTGKVFWAELAGSALSKRLEQKVLHLVKQLTFSPVEASFVSQGKVEVLLTSTRDTAKIQKKNPGAVR